MAQNVNPLCKNFQDSLVDLLQDKMDYWDTRETSYRAMKELRSTIKREKEILGAPLSHSMKHLDLEWFKRCRDKEKVLKSFVLKVCIEGISRDQINKWFEETANSSAPKEEDQKEGYSFFRKEKNYYQSKIAKWVSGYYNGIYPPGKKEALEAVKKAWTTSLDYEEVSFKGISKIRKQIATYQKAFGFVPKELFNKIEDNWSENMLEYFNRCKDERLAFKQAVLKVFKIGLSKDIVLQQSPHTDISKRYIEKWFTNYTNGKYTNSKKYDL